MRCIYHSLSILAIACCMARADSTSYTPPAGYFQVTAQGASDSPVSIPLGQKTSSMARIASVGSSQIVSQSQQWTPGAFRVASGVQDLTYFAEFGSGALRGVRYQIIDNSRDTLVLDTKGDDLTAHPLGAVAVDDVIRIRSLWTVAQVFGSTDSTVALDPKPNLLIPSDSILLFDSERVGQDKAPATELSYMTGVGWRATGDAVADQAYAPFQPGEPLIIRRRDPNALHVPVVGYVLPAFQGIYVSGGDGVSGNDAYVSWMFPEPVTLDLSGLHNLDDPASSVVRSSSDPMSPGDQLLSFGEGPGYNLTSEMSFFYLDTLGWRQFGSQNAVGSSVLLQPGKAYILRKAAANPGVDWTQFSGD